MLVNSCFRRSLILSCLLTNFTCSECQISQHQEYISLLGSDFLGMRGLICFNVKYVLLGRNCDFLGGYLVVTTHYLMVTTCYCSLSCDYCSLLVLPARYRLLLLVPTFTIRNKNLRWFSIESTKLSAIIYFEANLRMNYLTMI